jgi:protease I
MKVAILVENGFEDVELLYPYYRFQEAGYQVEVVGPKAGEVYNGKKGGSIKSTLAAENINLVDLSSWLRTLIK